MFYNAWSATGAANAFCAMFELGSVGHQTAVALSGAAPVKMQGTQGTCAAIQ